jgi:hypothetical protein
MSEKICNLCKKSKTLEEFYNNKKHKDGKSYKCKLCVKSYSRTYYKNNRDKMLEKAEEYWQANPNKAIERKLRHPEKFLCMLAKARAKKKGIVFSLKPSDIKIPEFCPVFGIKLMFSTGKHATDASPTLDKLIPELGYVAGNVCVMSKRANRIKGDASFDELKKLTDWVSLRIDQQGR